MERQSAIKDDDGGNGKRKPYRPFMARSQTRGSLEQVSIAVRWMCGRCGRALSGAEGHGRIREAVPRWRTCGKGAVTNSEGGCKLHF